MSTTIVLLVLLAAVLHASWNAVIKVRGDRLSAIALMSSASALIVGPFALFVDVPRAAAWPWLLASAATHIGYRVFLIRAYEFGDLSRVYPLARGAAPLMVAVVASVFIGEVLTTSMTAGVVLLAGGIILLAFEGGPRHLIANGAATAWSAGTACFIAGYTILDGLGARVNQDPFGYIVWLMLLDSLPLICYVAWRRGREMKDVVRQNWQAGLVAALLSVTAYAIVIWAMTRAPIAPVAALRETSVVFAAIIGALLLGERFGWVRWAAVACVVAGMMLLRL